ncbi:MAG: rhomboid family intramembrane serine protease [Desulfobacteraceae bacterium]|nr:rhomboid family intramembrane serine protease [Desulfobacteraceae bacterium]MBC2748831.1 rhomboid family intramembrane serine protease [Desulfobacteraceae bacterium]
MKFKASFWGQLICAIVIPVFIGLVHPEWIEVIQDFVYIAFLVLPIALMFGAVADLAKGNGATSGYFFKNLRLIPDGLPFGSDLKQKFYPWVTISLIFLNTFLFFALPEHIVDHYTFLPLDSSTFTQDLFSVFSSAFLHGDFNHLLGNMIFLWAFGSSVESRVGSERFLWLYFAFIIAAKTFYTTLILYQGVVLDFPDLIYEIHGLGASGAISGVMGLFIVRCYFSRVSYGIGILFIPFLSFRLRIPALLFVGLFFARNVAGSVEQMADGSNINYWAHVGGFLGGCIIAWVLKFHHEAGEEAVKVRAGKARYEFAGQPEAAQLYKEILEKEPENEEALLYFLDLARYDEQRQMYYFVRLVPLLVQKDFNKAIDLVRDYWPKYLIGLSGETLFRLGSFFYHNVDLQKARVCLDLSSEMEGPWQGKAMLLLSDTYEGIGNRDRSKVVLMQIVDNFSEKAFQIEAKSRLESFVS